MPFYLGPSIDRRRAAHRPAVTVALSTVVLLLAAAVAVPAQSRDFDARLARQQALDVAPAPAQQQAVAERTAALPGLAVTFDRATGATRTLSNRGGYLTPASPGEDPIALAEGFVDGNLDLLGLAAGDVAGRQITDQVYSAVSGATHLYLRQTFQGIPVYNGQLQVHVNRDGRILSVANDFLPGLAAAVNASRPAIGVADAVAAAFDHLGAVAGEVAGGELMILPIRRGEARLVWNFQIETADGRHHYDFTVDAVTGEVWTRFDWTDDASYRVYEQPVESPNHTSPAPPADGRTLQVDPHDLAASPLGWHDTGATSFTITRGNNVHAYEDRDGNNVPPAVDVDCGGSLACDFAIDLTMNPPAYVPAAVANLFYWNNVIHDIQYQYGFDEAAGNFQVNNFGNGGLGNDDVRAEAQDNDIGGSNCNANMATPPDGSRPRMQMFTCANATPEHDGDLDNGVIVHEYGHGISNRQVGGPSNVNCLNNLQQPGEGWSDWLGLVYTAELGDQGTDARGIGTYLFGQPPNGPGIRPAPYSTDFGVNNFTYSRINTVSVPHGVGFVWATILWEAYWELVNFHLFDPNLYNAFGGAGNQRMMLYVNEGLKGTACGPSFLNARDAIIQVATDNFGGEDVCRLWTAFARRGLGVDATTAGPNSLVATDGFSVPASCVCGNGICSAGEDCNSCPADCISGTAGASCGNGTCEAADGESCLSCPADCAGKQKGKTADRFCCGDGATGEGAVTCADSRCTAGGLACINTPAPTVNFCCGDGVCEGSENTGNCGVDCGGGCLPKGAACSSPSACCSNKCTGPSGGQTCK